MYIVIYLYHLLLVGQVLNLYILNPLPDDKILDWSKIETSCRKHFKVHLELKISAIYGRKHCEKRRNCLLQAISPFIRMFSTAIYL